MKKFTFKERLSYWFDNRMARGSLGLIKVLFLFSLILILAVAGVITAFRLNPELEIWQTFWESFATVVNAWMPYSEDGPLGYIILMTLAAVGGLFITSVLIGIVSSAIEERITNLRHGHSRILEEGHTVILGFKPGEFTLIQQLILSAAGKPSTIVVAGDMESDELRDAITENLEIPHNIRLLCRQADIFDAASLERLQISRSRSVIINPMDDKSTVKALLAVASLVNAGDTEDDSASISAIISGNQYRLPDSIAERHHITALQTNRVLAKMIAHSCTQSGLSQTFKEVFNFEGCEFYLIAFPNAVGKTFLDVLLNVENGIPSGILHDGRLRLNPPASTELREGDKVLVFTEDRYSPDLPSFKAEPEEIDTSAWQVIDIPDGCDVTIIGCNQELPTVLRELPPDITDVRIADLTDSQRTMIEALPLRKSMKITFFRQALNDEEDYRGLMADSHHVVLLSDYGLSEDDADMEVSFRILYLRDVRARYGLTFNITAEMCLEHSAARIANSDNTDYIITSNMSSLFLAQLSESPELIDVFTELLSNRGNELYIKTAAELHCTGTHTVRQLRQLLSAQRCIFLGQLLTGEEGQHSVYNLPLDEELTLESGSRLIVLSEN